MRTFDKSRNQIKHLQTKNKNKRKFNIQKN